MSQSSFFYAQLNGLGRFYGISTIVGYLMPNPVDTYIIYIYIYIYNL